jgi:hypothetical protein
METSRKASSASPSSSPDKEKQQVASRVLVAEQIAPRGIEALKAAGLDVDERLDLDHEPLL